MDESPVGVAVLRGLTAWRASLEFAVDPIRCLDRYTHRFGPAIRIERGAAPPTLVLIGPAFNRRVLTATDKLRPTGIWPVRGPVNSAQANLRATYLTTHGTEHERFADATAPLLTRPAVLAQFERVKDIAAQEVATWPMEKIADIHCLARDLAQRYAFELVFGETDRDRCRQFGTMLAAYHAANWGRSARLLAIDLPGFAYRRVLRRAEALQQFIMTWTCAPRCPHTPDARIAIAGMAGATPERAAAHIAGFALASYETTATTLVWALLLLACHPSILAALRAELAAAGPIADLPLDRLDALTLLDGVIRETMRLIAPVPFLGFKVLDRWEVAGQVLDRNSLVILSPHLTHRLPSLFPEPRRFRPERWRTIRPNAYEYLPFSAGARRCPGYLFAQNNLKVALATILPRLSLSVPSGRRVDREYMAITVPRAGLMMRIDPASSRSVSVPGLRGSFWDLIDVSAGACPDGHREASAAPIS